jgi:hypothetical protein
MNKAQKIAEIRRLISGDDDRHKAFYFTGTKPEGFRPGKDDLIYISSPEMEAAAKALKPGLFVGVINTDTARELVQWLNDELPTREPMPQPTPQQVPTPQLTELKQVPTEVQQEPQQEPTPPPPEFMPVTYSPRSLYRNNRI